MKPGPARTCCEDFKQPRIPQTEGMNIGTAEKPRHLRSLLEVRRFPAKNLPLKPKGTELKAFLSEGSGVGDML